MHHIHHTEGIILGSRNFGEDGKYFYLFTRELGLVTASASGVRKLSSRLRFILQDFAYVKVDLVRGKDFWRVTSASKAETLGEFSKNIAAVRVFTNIARLLRRLLPGEDANETLFTNLVNGLTVLEKADTEDALQSIEAVVVLRILNNLGYIGKNAKLETFLESPFLDELLPKVSVRRAEILIQINKALKETHL
jgi:DNA repair protein RecO (recombination protein O)